MAKDDKDLLNLFKLYTYRLEFRAVSLDEGRLRDVLEREFGIDTLGITRERAQAMPSRPPAAKNPAAATARAKNEIPSIDKTAPYSKARKLLDCLKDNKAWKASELERAIEAKSPITSDLYRLIRQGVIQRLERGYYCMAGQIVPPRINKLPVLHERNAALLSVLEKPRTASGIGKILKIPVHEVYRRIRPLMIEGKVRRVKNTKGRARYAFVRAQDMPSPPRKHSVLPAEKNAAAKKSKIRPFRKGEKKQENRFPAIIDLLRTQGPLQAKDINAQLNPPYSTEAGIYMALGRLHKRAQIKKLADAPSHKPLWTVTEGPQEPKADTYATTLAASASRS